MNPQSSRGRYPLSEITSVEQLPADAVVYLRCADPPIPFERGILTKIVTHAGSTLAAMGSPEGIWNRRREGALTVDLDESYVVVLLQGGGLAIVPTTEVDGMYLTRRRDGGDAS